VGQRSKYQILFITIYLLAGKITKLNIPKIVQVEDYNMLPCRASVTQCLKMENIIMCFSKVDQSSK